MSDSSESEAFSKLDPRVQRWIWKVKWTELRDIQEQAIPAILEAARDVVIASTTASGKTEAAFLPISSSLVADPVRSIGVLYISPLKALINDQFDRLESLFSELEIPVNRWHGDVAGSQKKRLLTDPAGVLLITPESLEAMFVLRGPLLTSLFADLRYVVVDELHAFIGTERGRQLQSLLHRLEVAAGKRVPRIALSATLGDMHLACEFLRPSDTSSIQTIVSTVTNSEVKLQVRGYRSIVPTESRGMQTEQSDDPAVTVSEAGDPIDIANDLYRVLRGGRHIVFANRRADVELYSHLLSQRALHERLPNEFWPHHGSLDKSLREDAEAALKSSSRPATIIATTTLELGIDVGAVESIAQIGPPSSVASMRQRLGRSGRRDEPAVMRVYVREPEITSRTAPHEGLRSELVQSVAMVTLLASKWCEPPTTGALHLSTLVQQTLSIVAQCGSERAETLWRILCEQGPFKGLSANGYATLLRNLGGHDLITQTHDGEIVLGLNGERLVNHYDFYAAFTSPEEYRLVSGTKTLGTMPIVNPVIEGMNMIFAARRWSVDRVDAAHKVIELVPSRGGRAPHFGGAGALIHGTVRQTMLDVYRSDQQYPFLDGTASDLLAEGRYTFHRLNLEHERLVTWGKDVVLFPWCGDQIMNTILIALTASGLRASIENLAIVVEETTKSDVRRALENFANAESISSLSLAATVCNKYSQKHHRWLDEQLLNADYASSNLDVEESKNVVVRMLAMQQ